MGLVDPGMDIDWQLIEEIDWDFAPPCEHEEHEQTHTGQPAAWFMKSICACGNVRQGFRCNFRVQQILKTRHFGCFNTDGTGGCNKFICIDDEGVFYQVTKI